MKIVYCFLFAVSGLFGGWLEAQPEKTQKRSRCGTKIVKPKFKKAEGDCDFGQTVVKAEYQPGDVYEIIVVVHVIYASDGTGQISEDKVHEQIRILNEDFRALPGSNSEDGYDTGIQFVLADRDPNGNPSSGITYTENDDWFEDGDESIRAEFGEALNWDPDKYLNMFVNSGGQALGYVVNMPWQTDGLASEEGVVVAWDGFGLQPGADEALGHTAAHEVGHYLGLEHTFNSDGDCPTGDCYQSGDLICDTNPHVGEEGACDENEMDCGEPNPIHNFMNYTPDTCIYEFTPEQANRMRCSLINYRSGLIQQVTEPNEPVESRWIPHITSATGGFQTLLYINNPSNATGQVALRGYDTDGNPLELANYTLNAGEHRTVDIDEAFPAQRPTHLGVTGDEAVLVGAAYKLSRDDAVTAHVHENKVSGTRYLLYPGEVDQVFDGIVVVNLGDRAASVTAETVASDGRGSNNTTLQAELPVRGRYINTFDVLFPNYSGSVVEVQSTQPIAVMALRGSRPGAPAAVLFANLPVKVE